MNAYRHAGMNRAGNNWKKNGRPQKEFGSPGAKESQNDTQVFSSFLLSTAMTWSTLIKYSTIAKEVFNTTN